MRGPPRCNRARSSKRLILKSKAGRRLGDSALPGSGGAEKSHRPNVGKSAAFCRASASNCWWYGGVTLLFRGLLVDRSSLFANRLPRKLAYQLVPAALITVVGLVALSSLSRTPDPAPAAPTVNAPIQGEAIFTATPRPSAAEEQEAKQAKTAAASSPRPRPLAANTPPRKPVNEPAPRQVASLPPPPPLPAVQVAEAPQPEADNSVMGKLRSTAASVARIPQWATNSMAGWFAPAGAPPRPKTDVPQHFQAAM